MEIRHLTRKEQLEYQLEFLKAYKQAIENDIQKTEEELAEENLILRRERK